MKKKELLLICIVFCLATSLYAQKKHIKEPPRQGAYKELFKGPINAARYNAWLTKMKEWRRYEKQKINYDDAEYLNPQLGWLKDTFIYVQMMAHDRYFYDPVYHKYTVNRYLNDLKKRYGGVDAVLIWCTYPNIGIDNRNQYDLLHDMPGGIKRVKQVVEDFHKRGVRVFFPIMIWDHGTRKIKLTMPRALIKEMKKLGADGLNGDTMYGVTRDYKNASDSLVYPLVFQPELSMQNLKMVEWNTSSWGYYWNYKFKPGVSIYKWLEPRHQVFVTNRWVKDRTDDLQYAFFNGIGYNTWENIWGTWNSITKRNAEAIRRMAAIYRKFPGIWNSANWEPYVFTLQNGIFASKFPGIDKTIYTIVNRDSVDATGRQLRLPYKKDMKYVDLWHGKILTPQREGTQDIYLSFSIDGRGFGAILAMKSQLLDSGYKQFVDSMHVMTNIPLAKFSMNWNPIPQQISSIEKTKTFSKAPKGMVRIPAAKDYTFKTKGTMIEGDPLPKEVGIQYPWESHPSRAQQHTMDIPAFYMDKYPVTNQQFKRFLDATHYHPEDDHNFLKDWNNGYPKGWGNKPVTWVSLQDARAYANWAGKRLPHEWEWQYAAQGTDGRLYPWGNEMDSTRIPPPDSSRSMRPPTGVDAYPKGASPFGVMDMVGNIWQWTDEYKDEHTRSAILKGGGYYRSTGSGWYFPRAYEVDKYGKYLLMAPSIDRSGAIGFRCVKDR